MAEKPSDTKQTDTKSFAQFLNEEPAPPETVTMAGYVARSARAGMFILSSGGQTLEVPVDAVQSFKVLSEGPQKLVEVQVQPGKIDSTRVIKPAVADSGLPKPTFLDHPFTVKEIITDLLTDKPSHTDPLFDQVTVPGGGIPDPTTGFGAAAGQPFVLATPHHAPPEALATQLAGTPQAQLTTVTADVVTTVLSDRPQTSVYIDVQTTSVYADAGGNTSVYLDPPNTSIYADPGGNTSVYLDPPNTSIYADPGGNTSVYLDPQPTSVYADAKTNPFMDYVHTPKQIALDPIGPPISVDPQPFAQAAPLQADPAAAAAQAASAQYGAAAAPNLSVTSVYADRIATSVYADAQTSVYLDPGNTSVYLDPGNTSVYLDPGNTSVYADPTSVYLDQPHTIKELAKDPIRDPIAGPIWNLPGMMF